MIRLPDPTTGFAVAGRVVTPDGVIEQGYLRVSGDRIAAVGTGTPPDAIRHGGWILPGFVDLHVHGGGGGSFPTADPDSARVAAAYHRSHGTTTMLASLVSAPRDMLVRAIRTLVPLVRDGVLAGIHLEGPYLAAERCGAHDPAFLRPPTPDELDTLLETGEGTVRMVTLAPELPGALPAIRQLVAAGVIAALGHTDATYRQTMAAIDAGATVGTHLFNGMRSLHHREPGPVGAMLGAASVTCELIADGGHVHDAALRLAFAAAGPSRLALVTDAIAAAGRPDGEYDLGGRTVIVSAGVARLAAGGALAGSTLTMDAALRHAVGATGSVVDAVRMASTTPAAALSMSSDAGALRPGLRADLVLLDDNLHPVEVVSAGPATRGQR